MELTPEQIRIAIQSPEHLAKWAKETGRQWMVFKTQDLIDALTFPEGHEILIQIIGAYQGHRMAQPSGDYEMVENVDGEMVRVPIMKDSNLTKTELDRCIRFLIGRITSIDPKWSLEKPGL